MKNAFATLLPVFTFGSIFVGLWMVNPWLLLPLPGLIVLAGAMLQRTAQRMRDEAAQIAKAAASSVLEDFGEPVEIGVTVSTSEDEPIAYYDWSRN
jgi:hypothetical protein